MPAISAKIFEISENVWGYDIAYLTRFCNIFSVLHKGRILTDALLNEPACMPNIGDYRIKILQSPFSHLFYV